MKLVFTDVAFEPRSVTASVGDDSSATAPALFWFPNGTLGKDAAIAPVGAPAMVVDLIEPKMNCTPKILLDGAALVTCAHT